MALYHPAYREAFLRLLPRLQQPTQSISFSFTRRIAQFWSGNSSALSISIPAISITLPGILSDIWDGLLKAVPKKKTSHSKKRHRQLAGKALKDVKSVVQCPACGKPKKSHHLCPYCVAEIKEGWRRAAKEEAAAKAEA